MRWWRLTAAVVVAAGVLTQVPARASTTFTIHLRANSFDPVIRDHVRSGDTIVWVWDEGMHDVTAYQGATWASPSGLGPGSTYSVTYTGGVIRYRSTSDSSLTVAKRCSGMCGVITDQPFDFTPPEVSIDAPREWDVLVPPLAPDGTGVSNPVDVVVSATDDVAVYGGVVRVYDETPRTPTDFLLDCNGCGTPAATLRRTLNLLPGSYVVEAIVADTSGNLPRAAPRVQFYVL